MIADLLTKRLIVKVFVEHVTSYGCNEVFWCIGSVRVFFYICTFLLDLIYCIVMFIEMFNS